MSARNAKRLAWLLVALSTALVLLGVALQVSIPREQLPKIDRFDPPDLGFALVFVIYAAIGALIAGRQPDNPVGWLLLAFGAVFTVSMLLYAYALHGSFGGALPATEAAAWVTSWLSDPVLVVLVLLFLLFPTGRFLTPRWRVVGFVACASALAWAASLAVEPGRLRNFEYVSNPVGIGWANGAAAATASIASLTIGTALAAALVSLVVRFRRAHRTEREQIKWLAFAALLCLAVFVTMTALDRIVDTNEGVWEPLTSYLALLAFLSFPVTIAVAILRYRLYDIDVVINRTLVYGALTATLAGTYLGLVLLLQLAFEPLTQGSDLAIAGSTLAVAALFRPARRRIQDVVDRRFYRRRYDAQRTLEAFSARLREEVDLEALGGDLRSLVRTTVQPAHVSLWLRGRER